jgi:hypothetical protein
MRFRAEFDPLGADVTVDSSERGTAMKYMVEIDCDDQRIRDTLPKLLAHGDVQLIGPWGERCRDILPVTLLGEVTTKPIHLEGV